VGEGRSSEVFLIFLRLGLSSFGGPMAHFVLFRREFVQRRAWIDEKQFGQLLTVCQVLPGPGSSQLGFSIGLLRAGWRGAIAAFAGFTAPSALLMFAFALALPYLSGSLGTQIVHGLKLVALAVVAFGLFGMLQTLCPDWTRRTIALACAALVLVLSQTWAALLAIALAALAGAAFCRFAPALARGGAASEGGVERGTSGESFSKRIAYALLIAYVSLLVLLWAAAKFWWPDASALAYASAFYRAGALAIGGGHVVLPFLQDTVVAPGWISRADFLSGYGAAQAVPGPMYSLAAFLGASLPGFDSLAARGAGALLALCAIFLPGFLLVAGIVPLWRAWSENRSAAAALAGASAGAAGLLGAALYDPVWISAMRTPLDGVIAGTAILILSRWRNSSWAVVAFCVIASLALNAI
jgi:chromate transporter